MAVWLFMVVLGFVPTLALLGLLWLQRGVSPRRLVWPDLSSVRSAEAARDKLLAPRMAANKMFYGPLFGAGVIGGSLLFSEGSPWGLALFVALATPALLAFVATGGAYLAVRRLTKEEPTKR